SLDVRRPVPALFSMRDSHANSPAVGASTMLVPASDQRAKSDEYFAEATGSRPRPSAGGTRRTAPPDLNFAARESVSLEARTQG
ncbi:hypothetical protein, partial [Brevibacterium sandarakinum]|uniref:hypothetical protein n=1 Tax=Brevibacterium sandarakinum TaxID=629680 RepID=UPI002656C002